MTDQTQNEMQQRLIEADNNHANNDTSPVTLISYLQQVTSGFLQQVTSAYPSAEPVQSGYSQPMQEDPNLQVESLPVDPPEASPVDPPEASPVDPPEASQVPYTQSSGGNTHLDAVAVALREDSGEGTGSLNDSELPEALPFLNLVSQSSNPLQQGQEPQDASGILFASQQLDPDSLTVGDPIADGLRYSQSSDQHEIVLEPCTCRHLCLFIWAVVAVFGVLISLILAIADLTTHDPATKDPTTAPTSFPTKEPALFLGLAQTIWGVEQQNSTGGLYNDSSSIPLNNS